MLIEPNAVLLETFGVPATDRLDIRSLLESFSEALAGKPQQTEKVEPIALGVVGQVRQFVREDGSPTVLGSCEDRGP